MAVTAVLALFEAELIREVTDPRTGISTDERYATWPPNSGELKIYCEGKAAVDARIKQYSQMPRPNLVRLAPPSPTPGRRANILVRKENPRFAEMCEKAKKADDADWKWHLHGIVVASGWWWRDEVPGWSKAQLPKEATKIIAEYARLGREPVYAGDMLVSPELAQKLNPAGVE